MLAHVIAAIAAVAILAIGGKPAALFIIVCVISLKLWRSWDGQG
jgi:hypothetical protein